MTHAIRRAPARIATQAATTIVATAVLASTLLAAGSAHAAVGAPTPGFGGSMTDIAYGNGGNIFQLEPMLFVLGLGSSGNPQTVANRNAALQYSFAVSGADTGLMTIEYSVRNTSAIVSFEQLRLMVYANPDGAADFSDVLTQTWGSAITGDPILREGRAFVDPVSGILPGIGLNNNLSEGPPAIDAACTAAPGCDATVGLQWNAPLLAPGEIFRVRLGLSDDGQALSGRFLQATAVSDPGSVLTLSGISAIAPVPEPGAVWMLLAGLGALGALARRRQAG